MTMVPIHHEIRVDYGVADEVEDGVCRHGRDDCAEAQECEQGIARSTCVIGSGRRKQFASWPLCHLVVIA